MRDIELLQYIHETAAMGIEGLQDVVGRIHDSKLMNCVQSQIREYQSIADESAKLLENKGETPKQPSGMARMSAGMMSAIQTMKDSSPSKISELVINGNHMGITKGLKHLHDYAGNDEQVRRLAEKLLSTEQANVEQMKPFL